MEHVAKHLNLQANPEYDSLSPRAKRKLEVATLKELLAEKKKERGEHLKKAREGLVKIKEIEEQLEKLDKLDQIFELEEREREEEELRKKKEE